MNITALLSCLALLAPGELLSAQDQPRTISPDTTPTLQAPAVAPRSPAIPPGVPAVSPGAPLSPEAVAQLKAEAASGRDTVTLNVENAEITSVLKMLALTRRVNIMAGPDVKGAVSVNLFEVPFDRALDSILGIGGFAHYKKDNIIYVTTQEGKSKLSPAARDLVIQSFRIEYATPEELLAAIKEFLSPSGKAVLSAKERTIMVQDAPEYLDAIRTIVAQQDVAPKPRPLLVERFKIDYAAPLEVLAAVEKFLSSGGKAVLMPGGKTIVVQDSAEHMATVRDLITRQDATPRQVLISVHIVRLNHNDDLSLGADLKHNWWDRGTVDYSKQGVLGSTEYDLQNLNRAGNGVLLGELGSGLDGLFLGAIWKDKDLFLRALATKGKVETLAAPEILALDGQEAKMIIGDKLGYKTNAQAANNMTFEDVKFLDVGTQVTVTPYIEKNNLIRLDIYPKISSGQITQGVPVENTAEVKTTMLVREGETIVIGGLIDRRKERTRKQIPFLGDIPYVGLVFGYNTWIDRRIELVVLITPHLLSTEKTEFMDDIITRYTGSSELFPQEYKSSQPREARPGAPDEPQAPLPQPGGAESATPQQTQPAPSKGTPR